jgi:Dynein heavy chain, N-terminal region 2
MIELKLYEGPKLDQIKGICEIAMKEWAIKSTLDVLELDLKNYEFKYAKYKDGRDSYVLKTLDEMLIVFEEFDMKVSSLKTNPFSKPFVDRIFKLEREFRSVVDVLD